MRFKCKHILLSHKDAENSSHQRALGIAMEEAEAIIKKLKTGEIKFEDTARRHSACLSGPSAGGELGWQEEPHGRERSQICYEDRRYPKPDVI